MTEVDLFRADEILSIVNDVSDGKKIETINFIIDSLQAKKEKLITNGWLKGEYDAY